RRMAGLFHVLRATGPSNLGAGLVLAGAGVDLDVFTDVDELRDLQLVAVVQLGGLHDLAAGVAANGRLGVGNLAHDGGRQLDGDHAVVVEHGFADILHAV